jgi:hypothetical protein
MSKFDMYDVLKDKVSLFKGTVVAITKYATGCTHYSLQAVMKKDGTVPDWQTFDETRLTLIKSAEQKKEKGYKGGLQPKVVQIN